MTELTWDSDDFDVAQSESGVAHEPITGRDGSLVQGYDCGSLTKGLVACYPFEKGEFSTAYDAALFNDGAINGASWTTSSKVGSYALSFDGSNDYVDITNDQMRTLADSDQFTIGFWIYRDSTGVTDVIVEDWHDNSGDHHYIFRVETDDTLNFYIDDGGTTKSATSSATIGSGTWTHAVAVADGSELRLYIDAVQDGSVSYSSIATSSVGSVIIGALDDLGSGFFGGNMDMGLFYDRALSQPEIQALYNLTAPLGSVASQDPRRGIVHEYRLDGDATDSVGSADGTNNGVTFVSGYDNQAGSFDGSNDYISLGTIGTTIADSGSKSMWVKFDSDVIQYMTWYGAQNSGEARSVQYHSNNNELTLVGWGGSSYDASITWNPSLDVWYFITVSWDGGDVDFYINGEFSGSDSVTHNSPSSTDAYLGVRNDLSQYLTGDLDEVRIYPRALKPFEVEQIYELGRRRIARSNL